MERRFMSLSSGLQFLGVTNVIPVLAKTLTRTDSRLDQGRLQFSPREVMESPLMSMITPDERQSMQKEDNLEVLQLEVLDRHGRSYDMKFGYLGSNNAYEIQVTWASFCHTSLN
uniref:Uncharacterized protein n=1 Tax=Arundo donax TaxID=35708 RepID=A0A0A9B524_ARUDO